MLITIHHSSPNSQHLASSFIPAVHRDVRWMVSLGASTLTFTHLPISWYQFKKFKRGVLTILRVGGCKWRLWRYRRSNIPGLAVIRGTLCWAKLGWNELVKKRVRKVIWVECNTATSDGVTPENQLMWSCSMKIHSNQRYVKERDVCQQVLKIWKNIFLTGIDGQHLFKFGRVSMVQLPPSPWTVDCQQTIIVQNHDPCSEVQDAIYWLPIQS